MEREHLAGSGIRIEAVKEVRLCAGRGVAERERFVPSPNCETVFLQHTSGVAVVLLNGAGQMVALTLGFDHADDLAVDIQHVVGSAGSQGELPDRYAQRSHGIDLITVLDNPAGRAEHLVDNVAGLHLIERCGSLRPVDDGVASLSVDLAWLVAGDLILDLLYATELPNLRRQLLDHFK